MGTRTWEVLRKCDRKWLVRSPMVSADFFFMMAHTALQGVFLFSPTYIRIFHIDYNILGSVYCSSTNFSTQTYEESIPPNSYTNIYSDLLRRVFLFDSHTSPSSSIQVSIPTQSLRIPNHLISTY